MWRYLYMWQIIVLVKSLRMWAKVEAIFPAFEAAMDWKDCDGRIGFYCSCTNFFIAHVYRPLLSCNKYCNVRVHLSCVFFETYLMTEAKVWEYICATCLNLLVLSRAQLSGENNPWVISDCDEALALWREPLQRRERKRRLINASDQTVDNVHIPWGLQRTRLLQFSISVLRLSGCLKGYFCRSTHKAELHY